MADGTYRKVKVKNQNNVGRDILFIERNMQFLKPGGRMAVVLPQGRFNNASDKDLREYLAEHGRILAVIGLHGNVFKPHTGTKTSVLFLQKWNDDATAGPLCPRMSDYPIFFATMREPSKDNSGNKIYRSVRHCISEEEILEIDNLQRKWRPLNEEEQKLRELEHGKKLNPEQQARLEEIMQLRKTSKNELEKMTVDLDAPMLDKHGHMIVKHDLFNHDGLTQDGIAEAFCEFAKKEKLSFFPLNPFDETRYRALLQRVEISELPLSKVNLSHIDFRFDPEFYTQANLGKEEKVKRINHLPLGSLCDLIAGPFGSAITADDYDPDSNCRYVRATDIKSFFLNDNSSVYVRKDVYEKFPQFQLKEKDILLTVVGMNFGIPAIIQKEDCPAIFSCKSTLLRDSSINPYYLLTYLSSNVGHGLVRRGYRGAAQPGINLSDIENVLVPIFGEKFQNEIEHLVKLSRSLADRSQSSYQNAEAFFLESLGLANLSPSAEKINIISFNSSFAATGRLDAEYYQQKYADFENSIINHPLGFTTIGAEFDLIKQIPQREKPRYNYIEISDVNVGNGTASFNCIDIEELPANAKQEVKRGDLIISKVRPNRGAVAIIDFDDRDLIVSGAFTVLREREGSVFHNETLKVLLRTRMYREWLLKFNIGTQYPVIRDEDILNLPIPCIDEPIQRKMAFLVKESFSLKEESDRIMDVAKRAVEVAIELNEIAGLAHIEANS